MAIRQPASTNTPPTVLPHLPPFQLCPGGRVLSACGFLAGRILAIAPLLDKALPITSTADYPSLIRLTNDAESMSHKSGTWLTNMWGLVKRLVPAVYPAAKVDATLVTRTSERRYMGRLHSDGSSKSPGDVNSSPHGSTNMEKGPCITATVADAAASRSRTEAFWPTLVGDESEDDTGIVIPAPGHVAQDFQAYGNLTLAALVMSSPSSGDDGEMRAAVWAGPR
ncbi:hypothetical protein N657DRAFT_98927 [Parathielavia appendiculata]|uniref:Uncharacterized protein n=1 Tax=Parathielavia appendiculata TaxID=2587402 RepID=A0AAN6Z194_9PEZI|nr:hypothetical protein N657DRAFT_98927 [Parathielavia appendiculata]